MSISHWSSPTALAEYRRAYDRSLGLWPIPFEERDVSTGFGSVHVVVSGKEGGDAIVFIHAASLSAVQWYPQAAVLGSTHRLFALDILGDIGLSRASRVIRSREDAAAWLGEALDGLGLDRPVFVGSSFGGFLSANFAARHPERVRGMALLAPAATLKPFRLLVNLAIRSGNLVPMPFTVKPGLRGMMGGQLPDERLVRQMEVGVAGFRYDHRGVYPGEIADADLSRIACPTLVVVGSAELIYDPLAATARARKLMPSAETQVLPGLGHLPGLQAPAQLNASLAAFLANPSVLDASPTGTRLLGRSQN